jgi:secreted Zn-dependent insulinase-like peptidase
VPLSEGDSAHCASDAQRGILANRREPWYGVHYYQEDSALLFENISAPEALSLPSPNGFVPRYLLDDSFQNRIPSREVSPETFYLNAPTCLKSASEDSSVCWWSEDLLFSQPRTAIHVLLGSDIHWSESYEESQMNALAGRLFSQLVASKRYPAALAGLHQSISWTHRYEPPRLSCSLSLSFSLSFSSSFPSPYLFSSLFPSPLTCHRGIEICCNGYTRHLPQILDEVIHEARAFVPSRHPVLFANVQEKYLRALRSCWFLLRYPLSLSI